MTQVTLDLLTKTPDGSFVLVLVEQGPWEGNPEDNLRRIQSRLYDYADVAIDGHLAKLHPESRGRPVVIRVDAYDTPAGVLLEFVRSFAEHISRSAEHQEAIREGGNISALEFTCEEQTLD